MLAVNLVLVASFAMTALSTPLFYNITSPDSCSSASIISIPTFASTTSTSTIATSTSTTITAVTTISTQPSKIRPNRDLHGLVCYGTCYGVMHYRLHDAADWFCRKWSGRFGDGAFDFYNYTAPELIADDRAGEQGSVYMAMSSINGCVDSLSLNNQYLWCYIYLMQPVNGCDTRSYDDKHGGSWNDDSWYFEINPNPNSC